MKRFLTHNALSRRFRRSQRGQSILLMAFAFIALVAFVGLVTDIALLFVRYASLRRAVDSAAIAAAGQIRENTDYGEVAMAAEEYIQLHGLQPDSVLVETCETDIYQWRAGKGPWQGQPHSEASYPVVSTAMAQTELCNWKDPRKLVRVSAQIQSPTTFLSLLGIPSLTLEATSVSETAVLDIALVLDISESMSKDTTQADYLAAGLSFPAGGGLPTSIRGECVSQVGDAPLSRERWGGCCSDPGQGLVSDGEVKKAGGGFLPNGYIWHDANSNGMWDNNGENGVANSQHATTNLFDSSTFNFSTLICNPFKDVKDAARMFIKRLDFVRGDRVVLVTLDRHGVAYDPDDRGAGGNGPLRPLIRSESVAITTLNLKVGVQVNPTGKWNQCPRLDAAVAAMWDTLPNPPSPDPLNRPLAYESYGSCGNTNIGGGILAANDALTDPVDVRREAVWVMIVLSDGAANVTDEVGGMTAENQYGYWGYCPWWTFCCRPGSTNALCDTTGTGYPGAYAWPECTSNNSSQTEASFPICNDNDPDTRYFCLDWSNGQPEVGNTDCGPQGRYDADDYARDMADFAGLAEVAPNKPGNFIAMFSVAFGDDVVNEKTGAPLLRYIADAGDNGLIDNNLQQDYREDRDPVPDYPIGGPYPASYGDPDPCEAFRNDPRAWCGQYYFATDVNSLTKVFEEIAGRLFTRLSR